MIERTRSVTRTEELSVAEQALAKTHDAVDLDVLPERGTFRFEETVVGSDLLTLESTRCTGVVRGRMRTGGSVVVSWLKAGRGTIGERRTPVGRPVLFHQEDEAFRWESFQKDCIRIDRGIVRQVAAERGGWKPGPLEFKPYYVPEGATLAAWWVMIRAVAAEVFDGPTTVTAERELALARMAAGGLLTAIPHWPAGGARSAPSRARMARAEAFVLDNVTQQVTVEHIAEAAGMSVRGLQSAFRRNHGMSPMSYLRGIRLEMARDMLESASVAKVAEAARTVAIPHLGRFAGMYEAAFGELPSTVLQRARAAGTAG